MGNWNVTSEEMERTEMVGSIGAVIKTPTDVKFTCSSCNRLLDYALVVRRLESVVTVEPCWSGPVEIARRMGKHHSQGTTYTHYEHCVHRAEFPARKAGGKSGPE